jgi:hypothetical protein
MKIFLDSASIDGANVTIEPTARYQFEESR